MKQILIPSAQRAIPIYMRLLLFLVVLLSMKIPVSAGNEPRINDSITAAQLFGDIEGEIPPNLTPAPVWTIGKERSFRVLDIATGVMNVCNARVFLITDKVVFWYDTNAIQQIPDYLIEILRNFEVQTLPKLHNIFGTENNPGVDNDPRFHVLFTDKIGIAYNGYFSADDSTDQRVRPVSNNMELLFLNTRLIEQGKDAVLNTLSHEFQHMIHFNYDGNEQNFINEGLSGLAEYLSVGKIRDVFIQNYLNDTGRSLIWWPDSGINTAYYGSSFLFNVYLYDRFGESFIRELVKCPENGLNGVDRALQMEGLSFTADDIFQQWTAALAGQLTQKPVKEWDFSAYSFPQNGIYRDIRPLPCGVRETHEISQYGIHFYSGFCGGPFQVTVEGAAESQIVPLNIPGGKKAWWSGAVSNSIAVLSHDFDLTAAQGPLTFEYDTTFDIEENYDYYYLLLRDQNGKTARLTTSTCTDFSPAQLNRGKGSTGNSHGIIHEAIDLTPWAGQMVRISFVYLTDTATVSDGILLDNFQIAAIGFSDDAENGENEWESEGFSLINSHVPQDFSLVLLHPQNNGTSRADFYSFRGGAPFSAVCPEGNCIFAVSAVNRNIRARAVYSIKTDIHQID